MKVGSQLSDKSDKKIEILFYFVFERKIIPTAVGEDRRKKNNQPKKNTNVIESEYVYQTSS